MKNKLTKIAALMLAFVMTVTCVPALPAAAANFRDFHKGETLRIDAPSGVNMHIMPSIYSHVITARAKGTLVYVLSVNEETGWMKVTTTDGKYTGFMEGSEGWFSAYDPNALPTVYPYTGMKAVVKARDGLYIHKVPVLDHNTVIGSLAYGASVDALGYTVTGWTQIRYNNDLAYVDSEWVTIEPAAASAPKPKPETFTNIYGYSAKVKSSVKALNFHRYADVTSQVITTLYGGQVVTILAQSKSWYKVTLNVNGEMETGYISRSYATKIDALKNLRFKTTVKTVKKSKKYHILIRGTTGMSVKASWKSSNKKIATVSKTGYVTAKKKGTAIITCTLKVGSRKRILKCKIKVK